MPVIFFIREYLLEVGIMHSLSLKKVSNLLSVNNSVNRLVFL